MAKKVLPRGIRNCNPLNIRRNPFKKWIGEVDYKSTFTVLNGEQCESREYNKVFCQFAKMEQGYRAAAIVLHDYIKKGHNTYDKLLNRWNYSNYINTEAYINAVANYCIKVPTSPILFCADDILPLMAAMTIAENGFMYDPFSGNDQLLHDMQGGFELAMKTLLGPPIPRNFLK